MFEIWAQFRLVGLWFFIHIPHLCPKNADTHTQKQIDEASWASVHVELCLFCWFFTTLSTTLLQILVKETGPGLLPTGMAASDFLPERNGPPTIAPLTLAESGGMMLGCQAIEWKHWDMTMQLNMRCLKASLRLRCNKIYTILYSDVMLCNF